MKTLLKCHKLITPVDIPRAIQYPYTVQVEDTTSKLVLCLSDKWSSFIQSIFISYPLKRSINFNFCYTKEFIGQFRIVRIGGYA